MNSRCQPLWTFAFCLAGQMLVSPLSAQPVTNAVTPGKLFSPPLASGKSPVDFFRQLLAMTSEEREDYLKSRSPDFRKHILAKVDEYEALNPNERALRLRATELRWYLMPLLRQSPANRTAQLAKVSVDVRELVQNRLQEWNILPPPLQQEFLDNERILHYFAHVDTSNGPPDNFTPAPNEAERAHWNALSEPERRQVMAGFNQFFELTTDEKEKTLNTLSEGERRQMDKTLQAFGKMPDVQRAECVNAFAKFSSMNASEQAEFLRNAERWSVMSPVERQAWRDLVVNVPQWPPLPTGFVPPLPTQSGSAVGTNSH
jgi:hypothetical protein